MGERLLEIYNRLHRYFGPQFWWPGETLLEIIVGAVLTQNTNWNNVEKAITNLKDSNLLSLPSLNMISAEELARQIKPSGYYNLKARRLKNLITAIGSDNASLDDFFNEELYSLRDILLEIKGIGPETADSILLYAAEKPIFVVDAYTHRILLRHNLILEEADYHEIQEMFMDAIPEDVALYKEYHALLVRVGKEFCLKNRFLCEQCPLEGV